MMWPSRIRSHFPQGVDGLADGAVLNELVIPAVRDGGAFTSVRGFKGIPQRDINFTTTFVRNYAHEFEKLDRLRQLVEERPDHASCGRCLSAGEGGRRPSADWRAAERADG